MMTWPSTLRVSATLIAVGVSLAPIDATRSQPPATPEGHVISGKIVDSRGLAPSGVVVQVTAPRPEGGGSSSFTIPVAADGKFKTRPYPPGLYALKVMAPSGYNFAIPSETAFGLVTIGLSDVRDVMLRTKRTVTVQGRFRMESDNPRATWPPHITVGAYLALDGMYLVPSTGADGGPNGTFTLRGALGPHVLRCGYTLAPGSWWWPSQVLLDGTDITNVPTDFGDAENSRLEVVFTHHPARLIGTVSDLKGEPVSTASVVLFSADPTLWQPWSTTSEIVETTSNGAFSIPLRPGRYLVRALPPGVVTSRQERLDYERLSRDALSVELGDRERKTLALTIARF
jgi:Carboxypeptidase regulatory-like domain